MNVRDLIRILEKMPQEAVIVYQDDFTNGLSVFEGARLIKVKECKSGSAAAGVYDRGGDDDAVILE